jgi:hypothetical protein
MKLPHVRLTIGQVMTLVAIVAVILGLFAVSLDDPGLVAFPLLLCLVVVIPVHFAIEGNRRDSLGIDTERASHSDSQGSPESFHRALRRTRPAESAVNGDS